MAVAVQEALDNFDQGQMQMQQMQAMMAMTSDNMTSSMAPPPPMPDPSQMPGMPQVDPAMAQAYMQMFQYLQQGLAAQQGLPSMGMPPMPFPGITPYAAAAPMAPPVEPSVSVSVEGMKFQYQLTEDDLHKVFSRYGAVKKIRVEESGASSVITFQSFPDAQAAMNDLNGKVLNGLDGTLRIQWVEATHTAAAPPPYPAMPPFPDLPDWGFPPASASPAGWPAVSQGMTGPAPVQGGASSPSQGVGGDSLLYNGGGRSSPQQGASGNRGVRKYTCRFLIGIENDKEFEVARRIIGAKGANMKKIVKVSDAKLRLRGVGSGYCEGAGQKESSEPLQLCISCTGAEGYKTAVAQTEELMKGIYEEYRQFCRDRGREVPHLKINLSEHQLPAPAAGSSPLPGSPGSLDLGERTDGESPGRERRRGRRSRGGKRDSAAGAAGDGGRGEPGPKAPSVEEIERFIDERNEARRASNFPEADRIRDLLHSRGVALMDEPGGRGRGTEVTTWRYWRD
mmetsp:Transcript_45023/g.96056  ORF Transcript_45023/g.96056 Transcript_45023/m.96056 type:complete len:509 (+) Transcript_45023:163-1689(+)